MLLQPRAVAAKKKEAKKSHGDLAQDAELVNGNPWALLIDAGSGGSRLHLYEWEPRVYHTLPPPISKPFTSEVRRLFGYHDTTCALVNLCCNGPLKRQKDIYNEG